MSSFWYDPMVQTAGMPGYGGGGPAMSSAQINASMGWNPAAQANETNVYGPQGFGGQTAQYAATGAAYGRAVGPQMTDNTYGVNGDTWASMSAGDRAAFNRTMAAQGGQPASGGGIGSDAAAAPSQPPVQQPMGSMFNQSSYLSPTPMGPSQWTPAPTYSAANLARYQQYMTPEAIAAYKRGLANQSGADNTEMFDRGGIDNLAANGGGRPAAPMAGDIGFNRQPSYPNLGYNPSMQNYFANPGMNGNQFQNRFGLGYPGQGTPSQYAPGAQMPPGFSQPYDVDNPGGSLPLRPGQNWYGGPQGSS